MFESSLHLGGGELAALITACVGTPVLGVIAVMKLQAGRLAKSDAERAKQGAKSEDERAKQFEAILKAQAERTTAQDAERSANFNLLLKEREATAQRRDEAMERAMSLFGETERRAHETQLDVARRLLEISAALNRLSDAQGRYTQLLQSIAEVQVRHDELLRRIAHDRQIELHQPANGV